MKRKSCKIQVPPLRLHAEPIIFGGSHKGAHVGANTQQIRGYEPRVTKQMANHKHMHQSDDPKSQNENVDAKMGNSDIQTSSDCAEIAPKSATTQRIRGYEQEVVKQTMNHKHMRHIEDLKAQNGDLGPSKDKHDIRTSSDWPGHSQILDEPHNHIKDTQRTSRDEKQAQLELGLHETTIGREQKDVSCVNESQSEVKEKTTHLTTKTLIFCFVFN